MEQPKENWRAITLAIGAAVGLISGLVAAYIIIQRAEEEESHPRLSAGEGVRVGLSVLGVLRGLADLAVKR